MSARRSRGGPPPGPAQEAVPGVDRLVVGLFASRETPADLILPALTLARALRSEELTLMGGFHSPLEASMLAWLLTGEVRVIVCPARSLTGYRVPRQWEKAIEARRLTLMDAGELRRRATRDSGEERNRLVARAADSLFLVHARPGGSLAGLAREALARGVRLLTFDHPRNRELILRGAEAFCPTCSAKVCGALRAGAGV